MSQFAEKLHFHIESLHASGKLSKTGTGRFDPLIKDISHHLGIPVDKIYVVACARPNNLNIRLTQGAAQHRHNVLGIGVIPTKGADEDTVASGLKAGATFIGEGKAQYSAVGVVIRKGDKWVIGGVVEAEGAGVVAKLLTDYPAMAVKYVPASSGGAYPAGPVSASGSAHAIASPTGLTAGSSTEPSMHSLVRDFRQDLASARLVFSDKLLLRFCASLLARPFLVLSGLSGSGKTKLAEAFARWLAPKNEASNPHYKIVSVGADWTSTEQVLGYPDALHTGRYESKPTLELLLSASKASRGQIAHFLILDEMNMSHVERYFADFLSAMETGASIDLYMGNARGDIPNRIAIPPNLYIAGTVNVDETTYLFSPKVLDRANVIEFRAEEDEIFSFLETFSPVDLSQLDEKGAAFVEPFLTAARATPQLTGKDNELLGDAFRRVFRVMSAVGREFGFRTLSDVGRFVFYYRLLVKDDVWNIDDAIDAQLYQRVLPRLHGSRAQLQLLLWALGTLCIDPSLSDSDFEKHVLKPLQRGSALPNPFDSASNAHVIDGDFVSAKYPLSCEKLYRMDKKLRDGFVSFMEA